ncbi:SURF1 family protein [Fulvimarina sp. MAC3]|uniref:SURF1 family protein n=1 Tax=Fulvimarina sp. MAC3 TaxID=3148887 RepID=UPI0031FE0E4F
MSAPESGGVMPVGEPQPMSRTKFAIALSLCVIGILILMGLGTWQVERLLWKESLIERIDARIDSDPVRLDAALAEFKETGDVDYQPVTLTGRFLEGGERYFFTTFDGTTGWNVYAPFLTQDGKLVIVNRGFVPYEQRDPAMWPGERSEGVVTFQGIARNAPQEKPGYFVPENDPAKDTFFWRDLDAMASGLALDAGVDLVPFFVDANRDPNFDGLPIGGQTIVTIPNNHLQYAFTWYGIGFVLIVMTFMLVYRQVRARRGQASRRA